MSAIDIILIFLILLGAVLLLRKHAKTQNKGCHGCSACSSMNQQPTFHYNDDEDASQKETYNKNN